MSTPKMTYRKLGHTGLNVSVLAYGTWSSDFTPETKENIISCIKRAYELGINHFDTAEAYGNGKAEELLGSALKELDAPRENLVISTKLMRGGDHPNDKMLSRKHIIEGIKNSLERLQLDYVDVIYCHRPDIYTTLKETWRVMDWVVEEGYAFYWATSGWGPGMISEAIDLCEKEGLNKPITDQWHYNGLVREGCERQLRHSFERYGYGASVWAPLAMGFLTGAFDSGEFPEGSRMSLEKGGDYFLSLYYGQDGKKRDQVIGQCQRFSKVAKEFGCSPAQLAIAWTVVNKDVSTAIFGTNKISELEENVKALDIAAEWTQELEDKVEEALANEPETELEYNTGKLRVPRRKVRLDLDFTT